MCSFSAWPSPCATPQEKHPIVIEHVMRIGKVDREIARILGVKKVVERKAGEDAGQEF